MAISPSEYIYLSQLKRFSEQKSCPDRQLDATRVDKRVTYRRIAECRVAGKEVEDEGSQKK